MAAVVISPAVHDIADPRALPLPADHLAEAPAPARSRPAPAAVSAAVYWRRRIVVLAVAFVVMVGIILLVERAVGSVASWWGAPSIQTVPTDPARPAAPAPRSPGPTGDGATPGYVVEPGDTLWSIARRLQPHGDPRPVVDRLAEQVGSSALRPGQRLSIEGVG